MSFKYAGWNLPRHIYHQWNAICSFENTALNDTGIILVISGCKTLSESIKLCQDSASREDSLISRVTDDKTFLLNFQPEISWWFVGLGFPLTRSSKDLLKTRLLMFPLARSKFKGLSETGSLRFGRQMKSPFIERDHCAFLFFSSDSRSRVEENLETLANSLKLEKSSHLNEYTEYANNVNHPHLP